MRPLAPMNRRTAATRRVLRVRCMLPLCVSRACRALSIGLGCRRASDEGERGGAGRTH